jgi:butyryl-CoA dehydrogenase
MAAYAMEGVTLRAQKLDKSGKGALPRAIAQVFNREQMDLIERTAKVVLAACGEGDTLRTSLMFLKRLTKYEPVNSIELRRQIAARVLDQEKYAY